MSRDHIDRVAGDLWFIFGERTDKPGCVDVSDGQDDVFECIPRAKAERLIKLRADFLAAVRAEYESAELPRRGPADTHPHLYTSAGGDCIRCGCKWMHRYGLACTP